MARRGSFRQADVTRAFRAAHAAGAEEVRVEIEPDGRMIIIGGKTAPGSTSNPWDAVLR